ncbi:MAG TPA: site-2 protease family protein [Nitrospirae bacterium]|nr:site-2 protease family protein [Nitrospirota bacterium]
MDIVNTIRQVILMAVPILLAVTFHELAHGYVAYRLGDPTAKDAGRLTFNPLKHLDPLGTIVFIVTRMIGWAKPVPVNPYNLRNPKRDMMWVSIAGPATNMALAVVSAILFKLMLTLPVTDPVLVKRIFLPLAMMLQLSVVLNIGLAVFNIIPIPPLDGSKILIGLLPTRQAIAYNRIEPYGFFILLALIFFRITDYLIFPIIIFLKNLLL